MNQTEKNLFIAACGVFVISVSVFIILMIITEPDIKAPTKYLPGKPVTEYSDSNVATDQVPAQGFVSSTTAYERAKYLNLAGTSELSNIPATSSITVNIVNGRDSSKPLYCRLFLGAAELYQVEAKEGRCLFINLPPNDFRIELNNGPEVFDQALVSLQGSDVAITLTAKSVKTFCRDSDNGLAYDQFGITFDQFGNDFSDTCISDRIIREYYCEDNQLKQSDVTCNTSCVSGVCN